MTRTDSKAHAKPSFLNAAQSWGAGLGALSLTFFVHPGVYRASKDGVTTFAAENYHLGWAMPTLWFVVTFVGMGLLSAVLLRVVFTGGVVSLIRRFT